MAHESFENEDVAAVLNEFFVPVKVDREERPDVDRVYMAFVQATTGSGGWPMSVWLTPNLEPFFGGTYFPPVGWRGGPGLIEILREIARMWRSERRDRDAGGRGGRRAIEGRRTGGALRAPARHRRPCTNGGPAP